MCLTNTVAANFTANVLLAIGAKPAMIEEASEATELAAVADAVLVNMGTLTPVQADVMRAAVRACSKGSVPSAGTGSVPTTGSVPWVLDPVACQLLSYRRAFVRELLASNPTVIRGNRAEIDFLLGSVPSVDSGMPTKIGSVPAGMPTKIGSVPSVDLQSEICNLKSIPSLATGEVDVIRRGTEVIERITGGVPMLQSVTATGCAQGAICAAFLGWGQTPVEALRSASRLMKRAGEIAWEKAKTPGTFQIALIDALFELTHP